jgi:chemotaxis protein methyltransferase CheR
MSGEGLRSVAELVRRETGMVVKDPQLPGLEAAIERASPGAGAEQVAAELDSAGQTPLLHRLVDEVTVQETYFFREPRELQAIEWRPLLDRARESGFGVVRVWAAACSTGEEAYTLAMLAGEALGQKAPPVTILATDISGAALQRAEAGRDYSERSVRQLPPRLRERYLVREGQRYRVKDTLRSLVRFRHHNLIGDPAPPIGEVPFDLIACRNVLIYFDLTTVRRVMRSLESALRPGGELILGAADRLTWTAARAEEGDGGPTVEHRRPRGAGKRELRRPLGLPRRRAEDRIEDALLAADGGELARAREIVEALLAADPLMVDAHFVRGLVALDSGDTRAAISTLRQALYLDPSFGLAAFQLGRAYDAGGDARAARRAYAQALRALDPEDGRHRAILDQIDLGDVAAACAARLREGSAR